MDNQSILEQLRARLAVAVTKVAGQPADPVVRLAQDPRFGDYQCNAALPLAKTLGAKPRDVAERIVAAAQERVAALAHLPEIADLEIAGPGFINIRLKDEYLAARLAAIVAPMIASDPADDRLGLAPTASPQRVVVDYSGPNIAKQMHVGHLRPTIIGDVFARVLAFEGHGVVRQNHVGDWGTQFGMLIAWYRQHPLPTPDTHADPLAAVEADYRAAHQRFEADPAFAATARAAVRQLQSGDAEAQRTWEALYATARHEFNGLYRRLHVLLTDADLRGESFYNAQLADVVDELMTTLAPGRQARAEARIDNGAACIFFTDEQGQPAFRNPDGDPLPMMIRKSDGAFLYATTDLAALRFRIRQLGGRRCIYVTDARQKLHFQMLFAAARAAGWAGPDVTLEHTTFGSVLGADRKPLKTRTGENVKLRELLDEAERRAADVLTQRAELQAGDARGSQATRAAGAVLDAARDDVADVLGLSLAEQTQIARAVGVAAVKYADLARDRNSDYVFDWDKLLAFQGNTAPYMLYAYARIRSIYRKAAERSGTTNVYGRDVRLVLGHVRERTLALRLLRFSEALDVVATDLSPHVLCTYLFELAQEFMRFYEECPVIAAPDEPTRLSRLRLCDLAARTLKLGLHLLGIETLERM